MSELKCPACRCRTFAKVDEPTLDGGWDNSKLIRCVECKRTYAAPPRPDAPSAGEWMPIETAPKDGRDILLAGGHPLDGRRQFVGGWWAAAGDWSDEDGRFIKFKPTHWRPLPAPPQADGGEG